MVLKITLSSQLIKLIAKVLRKVNDLTTYRYTSRKKIFFLILVYFRELIKFILIEFYQIFFLFKYKILMNHYFSLQNKFGIIVCGNGPSISQIEINKLKQWQSEGNKILCINDFYKHYDKLPIVPDFYLLSDPSHKPNTLKGREIWEYLKQVNERVLTFVPLNWAPIVNEQIDFASRVKYFNDNSLESFSTNIKPTRARGYVSLTAFKGLAVSYAITQGKIGIIGIDNDLHRYVMVDVDNRLMLDLNNHFYDSSQYFVDYSHVYLGGIGSFFKEISETFLSIKVFPSDRIYNLDPKSFIDHFQKVEPEIFINERE